MRLGTMRLLAILLLCLPAFGQATYKGGRYSGAGNYVVQGQGVVGSGENFYCPAGAGELTEGTPTWGASDGVAQLPTQCVNTAMSSTPGGTHVGGGVATTYTPADTTALNNALGTLQCGDTIVLTAGSTYTGTFTMPALSCDGGHWITVKSSGVSNPNFPGEGVRATPCIAGISNDATHGRSLPGYPDYACASFPTVLSARIVTNPQANGSAIAFATGANHYRFIGIEFAKDLTHSADALVQLAVDGLTLGSNHIIFDRCTLHGVPWTPTSATTDEAQNGISAKNSQWIALINSWGYDTYCNSSCIDSHNYGAGTGIFQDGPHKLYNNFLATSGETWLFGGGGQGPGTPSTRGFEARLNHSFKPLTWMVPIDTCINYYQAVTKNLGEFKNMTYSLLEGNVYENSWQGCQSDQTGFTQTFNPSSQNNHQGMAVNFDGSNVVVAADAHSFTHNTLSSPLSGNPVDAANCPPGGCILEDPVNNVNYRFCNSANGCDQNGIPNLKCGTGVNAGNACTNDSQCPGSYCAPTTTARICNPLQSLNCSTTTTPVQANANVNACVPGDCPNCRGENITFRFNEIYNVTQGVNIITGLSSHCKDQGAGLTGVSVHDNLFHGLSREMSNGHDPYSNSNCVTIANNVIPPSVINTISVRHNTCAVETGNPNSVSGFGSQVDRTDSQYMRGISITDNVAAASWGVSGTTKGIGGASGLANTYVITSCQRYFTMEAPTGTINAPPPAIPPQDFTFAGLPGGGTNYLVSLNGQYTAITSQGSTGFHVTATTNDQDTIVVRDLSDCQWTFASNLLGKGTSGQVGISPNFFGSGQDQAPYPHEGSGQNLCGTGNAQTCILDESAAPGSFINNFVAWNTGRDGNFGISGSSPYFQTASDAQTRPATGKSPGADLTLLAAETAGVRSGTFLPPLTVTTSSLPAGIQGVAYNAQLQASFGASQFWNGYKGWFLETTASLCAGSCGSLNNGSTHSGIIIGRAGIVNGPLAILNVSRTGCPSVCLSNYTVSMTIVGGAWEVGQTVSMAQFLDFGTGASANDSSFNGTCTISAISATTFSCTMTNGVNVNIASHAPNGPRTCGNSGTAQCDSVASFAPISAGTYTFWVGARDGAFQVARGPVTLVVGP